MKKKIMKKALAGMLATTMALGMSMVVFADPLETGTGTGAGDFEGHVAKKVVKVTLPTAAATTFAYKMDPEGLIPATENAKYSGATFEAGANVYFQSATNTYTKDSAKLKVINKGTADVDVTIKAEIADDTQVGMAADTTGFTADNKAAQLYLGLKVADKATAAIKKIGTTDGAEVVVGLKGKSDNFEITYDTTDGYGYKAKAGVPDAAWNSFEFGLTGACNPYGDYSATGLAASDVTVTWSYIEHPETGGADMLDENATTDAPPSIATTTYTATSGSPLDVTVNLGGGDKAAESIDSVKFSSSNSPIPTTRYSFSENTLTLDSTFITNNMSTIRSENGLKLSVVFNDTAKTAVEITITATTE